MRFRDLGTLVLDDDGVEQSPGGEKPARILAALLINANTRVPVETLMNAVWGDRVSAGTTSTLESHVWRLRKVLEPTRARRVPPSVLINDRGGYQLIVSADRVDSLRFEQLAEEVRNLLASGQPARALRQANNALALWRGRPYTSVADEAWAAPAVARLEEVHAQTQERRVVALLAVGDPERALADLEVLTTRLPFRERLWHQRMLALYRCGRAEEALRTYQRARAVLRDELGLEPGRELRDLQVQILDRDPDLTGSPGPAALTAQVHLPHQLSPLVGRAGELASLVGLLGDHRLVTVAGSAGCGKTRLAIDVARSAATKFPDGVWFVDLTAVTSPDLVVDLVTSALGVPAPVVGTSMHALATFVRDRRMLLVLDNCEHVLAGVAEVIGVALEEGRECSVLATSREPVGLPAEVIWSLGPLAVPDEAEPTDPAAYPAVALFLARVRSAVPTLNLDAERVRHAAAICVAVDGLPLAIELAAARSRSYSLGEIAEQVAEDPSRLARIGRGPADHRRTVRAAIEWSHRSLPPPERVLHRRLSVLPGPFTPSAATAVGGPDLAAKEGVTDLLARLVHRSMLTSAESARRRGRTSFSQLSTIRGHAAHALRAAGEQAEAVRRRDDWVLELVSSRPGIGQADEAGWYDEVEDSFGTVRATLQHWLVDERQPAGVFVSARLSLFWYYRRQMVQGDRWLQLATTAPPGTDPADDALARLNLSAALTLRGRADLARAHIAAALTRVATAPARRRVELGEHLGALSSALAVTGESALLQLVGDRLSELSGMPGADELASLAEVVRCRMDLPAGEGADIASRAESIYLHGSATGALLAAFIACGPLSVLALRRGGTDEAMRWLNRGIELQHRMGGRQTQIFLEDRAHISAVAGDQREALVLAAAAYEQSKQSGIRWPARPSSRVILASAREQLDPDDYEGARRTGQQLTFADVLQRPAAPNVTGRAGIDEADAT